MTSGQHSKQLWEKVGNGLTLVWQTCDEMSVDLSRLGSHRGKALHATGPPVGPAVEDEIAAMIQRLRVQLEATRRELLALEGDWWPYIERVDSNIPEFCEGREKTSTPAKLVEGDEVWFRLTPVDPTPPGKTRIEYGLRVVGPHLPLQDEPFFRTLVPAEPTARISIDMWEMMTETLLETRDYEVNVRPRWSLPGFS